MFETFLQVPFDTNLECVVMFAFLVCLNIYLIKSKIPILQLLIGVFTVVIGMLFPDLPLFPFLNLILVISGIVNVLSSITNVSELG